MSIRLRTALPLLVAATIAFGCSDNHSDVQHPSNDATLSDLRLTGITLTSAFDPAVTNYVATVGALRSKTTVTATPADNGATVEINGVQSDPNVPAQEIVLNFGVNTLLVSVAAEDGTTTANYTVEVTRADIGSLEQTAYIKASNTESGDGFGGAVAIFRTTLALAAVNEGSEATGIDGNQDSNTKIISGAVYVFGQDAAGTWTQQAYIKASNTDGRDGFGEDVALFGDTLIVGAPGEDSPATGINGDQFSNASLSSGAAYVFDRDSNGAWSQTAYIKASNANSGDLFGYSVALYDNVLIVGAPGDDRVSGLFGSAYVFVRDDNGNWSEHSILRPSTPGTSVRFGHAVALHGDTLVVGDSSRFDSGPAYVFTRDQSGDWSEEAQLTAVNGESSDLFGSTVAIYEDRIGIGAEEEQSTATGVNGDESDNSGAQVGAAYVFSRDSSGNWNQNAYMKAATSFPGARFGVGLDIGRDMLAVGALRGNFGRGAVTVFTQAESGEWSLSRTITASNDESSDSFSIPAIGLDNIAIGAPGESSGATGVDGNQTDNSESASGAVYILN